MSVRKRVRSVAARLLTEPPPTRFTGDYASWEEARAASGGYDEQAILEKVTQAALKVKNGEAVFERDSVLFDSIQYSWPVLAGLLWVASRSGNSLNVLDFGGSLATAYNQNRRFLQHLGTLRWNVIEQEPFVRTGRELFETEQVRFYESIGACTADTDPNVALVSASLAYVPQPYVVLEEIRSQSFAYLIFDRNFFSPDRDRLTVQTVPPWIYDASYPAWFLDEQRFLAVVEAEYERVAEFEGLERSVALTDGTGRSKGFIFERRSDAP